MHKLKETEWHGYNWVTWLTEWNVFIPHLNTPPHLNPSSPPQLFSPTSTLLHHLNPSPETSTLLSNLNPSPPPQPFSPTSTLLPKLNPSPQPHGFNPPQPFLTNIPPSPPPHSFSPTSRLPPTSPLLPHLTYLARKKFKFTLLWMDKTTFLLCIRAGQLSWHFNNEAVSFIFA